jgi:hypothetical protein
MSQVPNVPKPASQESEEIAAPCRCAFYQAAMQQPSVSAREHRALRHSCLLNPGKSLGPDENPINPSDCTLARQSQCQAQRRQAFDRLHATLHSLRVAATTAQG